MSYRIFRKMVRRLAVSALLALAAGPAWAKCELATAPLPVTVLGSRALLAAKINGQDAQFVVDSGAFFSTITAANADRYNLPRHSAPINLYVTGVTGDVANLSMGVVKTLTLANAPIPNVEFIVGGGEVGEGAVGLLGQNFLGGWDMEYDFANGMMHLWTADGCGDRDMAYWATTSPASVIDLFGGQDRHVLHTKGSVYVNGVRLTAIFDTGADRSVMTRHAAAKAGIKPGDPGVVSAGYSRGLGQGVVKTWVAPVKSFRIGKEETLNTQIRFGDLDLTDGDMLVGMDFFLAHHIFVSNTQRKLYLTYNGGPVFNPSQTPLSAVGGSPTPADDAPDPTDAAGYARRGAGYAARNNVGRAIADLSKAIEMAPTVADYRFQRGVIYARNRQPDLAIADFDETLRLKPDDAAALVDRAALRLGGRDRAEAVQDLEAADIASAKQDDIHLKIAILYARADRASAAIDQYSLWIDAHGDDARLPDALNGRCWERALTGVDLDKALHDCNQAIRNAPKSAAMFESRGLVYLRLGDLDKAIADDSAALAINPELSWSLYGRGLAKQRKGQTAEGAADISAALEIDPKLADEMRRRGVTS